MVTTQRELFRLKGALGAKVIFKWLFAQPRQRQLIIMTSIFIIEVLSTFLRVLLPPLSTLGESLLNVLFLSVIIFFTIYLFLFRSWVGDNNKREPGRTSTVKRNTLIPSLT